MLPGLKDLIYLDEDGLLAGYALFRETFKSATKVVIKIKNPKQTRPLIFILWGLQLTVVGVPQEVDGLFVFGVTV